VTKIALVSPYSWTYPGGVTRHVEALAEELLGRGHDVRVLAPYDGPGRGAGLLHRGAVPQPRPAPDYLVSLGRTVAFPMNGAQSNLAITPYAVGTARRELRTGGYDVVHVHEPIAPMVSWDALASTRAPLVATYHVYSENVLGHTIGKLLGARRLMERLHARIAVSEAAAWTARRFFGGHYRIVPNGVALPDRASVEDGDEPSELRIVFVGQAVERKGLPVLLRAFEALREHIPARLDIVGATDDEVEPLLLDRNGVRVLGKVSDERKRQALAEAHVLCAPSLGGESFGMVLTEAFAEGTPVVASDIAGYRDVVRDGVDGLLVPRGDATELAEALRDLWLEPRRRLAMARAAREHAHRYAWPRVAEEVLEVYDEAREAAAVPRPPARRAAIRLGLATADNRPRVRAQRLAPLEVRRSSQRRPAIALARRAALALASIAGLILGVLALRRIGLDNIGHTLLSSSPTWVLVGLGLMCASMVLRALSWHQILRAALPGVKVKRRDAAQGTFIGVLMSATLPARLGEPSRALIVARRLGRARDQFPVVLGTIVSQTLLNLLALVILGAVMFSTIGLFQGHEGALLAVTIAPFAVLLGVLAGPALLRRGPAGALLRRAAMRRLEAALTQVRAALDGVRRGLVVFRHPRFAATASLGQLAAWGLQWLSCYVLLVALGLDHRAGIGAAAAVLFAVNVTAVLPATPSNLGVFQAACVAVLTGAYHVSSVDALGYGIILQAVEVTTAVVMGMPALVKEGLSWRDVRLRALAGSPVRLEERATSRRQAFEAEA
jgi:phosphatidyl-myo-inositol alpha-mannosyltransferase